MGRITVTEFVSIDGVMEAPGGEAGYAHTNWVGRFPGESHFEFKLQEILEADALLLGRLTYESFAGAWPDGEGEFAEKMNAMPKFVVSRTLRDPGWNNTTVLEGEAVEAITLLKQSFEGEIQVPGSRSLVRLLRLHDLVDSYNLMVFPYVLGSGFRVFDDWSEARELKLLEARAFDRGVVLLRYAASADLRT